MGVTKNSKPILTTFVLHVKQGYEKRLEHIEKMLLGKKIDFELILDGDICDLNNDLLDEFFAGSMCRMSAQTSCAYKHILCFKKIVSENLEYALILEDDIFLLDNFNDILNKAIVERSGDCCAWYVGFEATCLMYVPRSQRKKGVVTYKSDPLQCTGAYLVNQATARNILAELECAKCELPIDWYLDRLQKRGVFNLYWSYPVVAEQGSHNGKMNSSLSSKYKKGLWGVFKRKAVVVYKKWLYFFR